MNKHKPQSVFPQGLFKEESKDHQPTYLYIYIVYECEPQDT